MIESWLNGQSLHLNLVFEKLFALCDFCKTVRHTLAEFHKIETKDAFKPHRPLPKKSFIAKEKEVIVEPEPNLVEQINAFGMPKLVLVGTDVVVNYGSDPVVNIGDQHVAGSDVLNAEPHIENIVIGEVTYNIHNKSYMNIGK